MKTTSIKLAIYLISLTLGMALILSGISWLGLFGAAIVLSAILFASHLSFRRPASAWFAYIGLFVSLLGGVKQFAESLRHGPLFMRVPPHWTFDAFIVAVWLSAVMGECWQWQQPLHGWTVRHLKRLSPDEREKYLARLDEATRDSLRKEVETNAA